MEPAGPAARRSPPSLCDGLRGVWRPRSSSSPRIALSGVPAAVSLAGAALRSDPHDGTPLQPHPTGLIADNWSYIGRPAAPRARSLRRRSVVLPGDSGGAVTAGLYDITDHTTWLLNGGTTQATGSIVKVDILAALVEQAKIDHAPFTTKEEQLASRMIEYSDNDAATTLWDRAGDGPGSGLSTGGCTSPTPSSPLAYSARGSHGRAGVSRPRRQPISSPCSARSYYGAPPSPPATDAISRD